MNLFPGSGRELQISARKPLTHRLRVVVVFVCSDSLSRKKRDGTLELLFLTHLRPIDVVFEKLFAHGLNLFYGLLALLNCLFLSIAVGIFASSISKDQRKALWASIGLLFIIYVGPYILIE